MKIYLDGKYVSEDEAKISVFDHGLLYGDGVFEGIRVYGGRIFRLEQHLDRLLQFGEGDHAADSADERATDRGAVARRAGRTS